MHMHAKPRVHSCGVEAERTCMKTDTGQLHPEILGKAGISEEVRAGGAEFSPQGIDVGGVVGENAEDHARFWIVILELVELTCVVESDQ